MRKTVLCTVCCLCLLGAGNLKAYAETVPEISFREKTAQETEEEEKQENEKVIVQEAMLSAQQEETCHGIVITGDVWYVYGEDGELIRNATPVIDGKKYYVNGEGIAQSGWLRLAGWQMYFDPETYEASVGITEINGKTYLFDENGVEILKSRTEVINGKKYWFQPDGSLLSGWCRLGDWQMYFDPETYEGACGIVSIEGNRYAFDENGVLLKNATPLINGKKYYVNQEGRLRSGWLRLAEWQMYFDPETYEASVGITAINGKAYLFDENGVEILKSRTEVINGKKYWFQPDGSLMSGWCRLGDWVMYYDPETYEAASGLVKFGESRFLFDENGVLRLYYYYSEKDGSWEQISDIITVGKRGAEYQTISDAVGEVEKRHPQIISSPENDLCSVILIWEGVYEEGITLGETSGLCFVGAGNVEITSSDEYPTGAVNGYGCNIWENLTFSTSGKNAYAYHYEAGPVAFTKEGSKTVFRNCSFQAVENAGCGIGMGRMNSTLEFYNCRFSSQSRKGLYIHNSTLPGSRNAKVVLQNCSVDVFWLEDAARINTGIGRSSELLLKVQDSVIGKFTFYGGNCGNLAGQILDHIPEESENIRLDPDSGGNTLEGLNCKKES